MQNGLVCKNRPINTEKAFLLQSTTYNILYHILQHFSVEYCSISLGCVTMDYQMAAIPNAWTIPMWIAPYHSGLLISFIMSNISLSTAMGPILTLSCSLLDTFLAVNAKFWLINFSGGIKICVSIPGQAMQWIFVIIYWELWYGCTLLIKILF